MQLQDTYNMSEAIEANSMLIGEIQSDDVKVYIKQDIYKLIEKFSSSNIEVELGGILIGDYVEEHGKIHVIISGYIEAEYTDASSSSITFTHETWEHIYNIYDKQFSDKRMVGWHHTHPSYGIFLSSYDTFIQQNFFDLPWQIAYVVDPINKTCGFFQWKNDKIQRLDGFYVYDI